MNAEKLGFAKRLIYSRQIIKKSGAWQSASKAPQPTAGKYDQQSFEMSRLEIKFNYFCALKIQHKL